MTEPSASKFPVRLVCPLCRGELQFGLSRIVCSACAEEYVYEGGFPNLIRGGELEITRVLSPDGFNARHGKVACLFRRSGRSFASCPGDASDS